MLKTFVALGAVTLAAAVVAAGTARASSDATALTIVPLSGATSDGGAFTGTLSITGFAVQGGQVVALGTVSGTATNAAGQTIGTVGRADPDLPPHLHFEMRPNGHAVDPLTWLRAQR